MREIEPPFEIEYHGTTKVTEAEIKSRRVFYVQFTDGRRALTMTIGEDRQEKKFWTSIPEGRQQEAEEVGKLIADYIRAKRK
ncbi:hypothetical protein [Mucilaginibacter aquariorum]|uniref:Uncharacterized protein n=1 Tax=Mucilaginibacter aquariorum TaxID=2967225 RepID=A0ABT1SXJ0_9SPHI|nr:hypothetical protein [Mucilaginibacter aquariorum]MCQ6957059.1 hypothetical protein [Mucilaginibacter aquariorum]